MKCEWLGGPRDGDTIDLPAATRTVELYVKREPSEPYDQEVHDVPWAVIDLVFHPSGKVLIPFYSARRI